MFNDKIKLQDSQVNN